jgi:hypothetical protein
VNRPILRARPTLYRGVRMRSRLEATVAEWLDARNVKWEYEPIRYAGRGGSYLPDFRLPDVVIEGTPEVLYLEVKPNRADRQIPGEWVGPLLSSMEWIWESEPRAWLGVASSHDDTFWRMPLRYQTLGHHQTWTLLEGHWVSCDHCGWTGIENARKWEGEFYADHDPWCCRAGDQEDLVGDKGRCCEQRDRPVWRCPGCSHVGFVPVSPWASAEHDRYLNSTAEFKELRRKLDWSHGDVGAP